MSSSQLNEYLAQAIDEHLSWLVAWHKLAFVQTTARAAHLQSLPEPEGFTRWRQEALVSLPQDQPAIEKLIALHEQLHTLSRLVLMKTADGQTISAANYADVTDKYQELMRGLRRLEQAFGAVDGRLDVLTGLRTRVGMHEDIARELGRFARNGKSFCVAIMDVDHFKKINDTYGHDAGDRVLMAVANHITRSLRIYDDAYRMGGEEFLLCLKEADKVAGLTVLERLRMGLERRPITLDNGTQIPVTASFGMVVSVDDITVDQMLTRADQALYRAKNEGRNRVKLG